MGGAKDIIKGQGARGKGQGFTLVELLVALAILSIVGIFATPILLMGYRAFETSSVVLRLQNHLHMTMREIVDYIEASTPLPGGTMIGQDSVDIVSPTEIRVFNFVNPRRPDPPQPNDFTDTNNYTTTTITYSTARGDITSTRTGGGLTAPIVRTLGVPEQASAGAPAPVTFANVEFRRGANQNDVIITLEAQAATTYGAIQNSFLTSVATARGRRAGQ